MRLKFCKALVTTISPKFSVLGLFIIVFEIFAIIHKQLVEFRNFMDNNIFREIIKASIKSQNLDISRK